MAKKKKQNSTKTEKSIQVSSKNIDKIIKEVKKKLDNCRVNLRRGSFYYKNKWYDLGKQKDCKALEKILCLTKRSNNKSFRNLEGFQ